LNRGIGNRTAVLSNTNRHATQRHLMAFVMSHGWLLESQGNLFSLNEMRDGVKRHEHRLRCSHWLVAWTICRIVVDTENHNEAFGLVVRRMAMNCVQLTASELLVLT